MGALEALLASQSAQPAPTPVKPAASGGALEKLLASGGLPAEPATAPSTTPRKGAANSTVDTLVGGTADAIDLLWTGLFAAPVAAAGEAMTRIQLTANDALGIGEPMSRRDVSKAGQATAARINEQLGTPVRSTLRALGLLSDRQTTIDKAMEAAMGYVEEKAAAAEKASGGRVLKEDVLMGVNTLFGALGAKGVQYTAKTAVQRARAKEGLKELAKIQEQGDARLALEEAEALSRDAGGIPKTELPRDNPAAPQGGFPQFDARVNAERQAYELMQSGAPKAKVEAIIKRNPAVGQALDGMMARRQQAASFLQELPEPVIREDGSTSASSMTALLHRPSEMGPKELAARDAAAGIARGPLGEPILSANPEARAAGRSSRDPSRRPTTDSGLMGTQPPQVSDPFGAAAGGGRSVADPRRRTVEGSGLTGTTVKRDALGTPLSGTQLLGVAGATGLGLAALYGDDDQRDAAAAAAAGGAFILGKGKGITLEGIRALPDTATLGEIRGASATTLNTIEALPGNRAVHAKQAIGELLRRQEVTKAERDIVQGVLDATPGDTITAKQLMAGVKEATGDFELTPKASEQFADYGLENIDRASAEFYDNPVPETAAVGGRGIWEVFDAAGDVIMEARGAVDEASALQFARDTIGKSRAAQDSATTTIYQSPFELGTNNHFSDPNYFAHTRSFYEGGVKHVVEMQSDLAQKAGKVLTPEERARLEAERNTLAEERLRLQDENSRRDIGAPGAREASLRMHAINVLVSEIGSKLAESGPLERVSPMLKRWDKRLVREELAEAAREGQPTVRFATADTVAKVEGWPRSDPAERARWLRSLEDQKAALDRAEKMYDRAMLDGSESDFIRAKAFVSSAKAGIAQAEAALRRNPESQFQPEHQGIYDRYAKETTTFLKALGGKEITDSAGHTWIEVPTEGTKRMPGGKRVQQFGAADPELVRAMGVVGGGAAVAALLSDEDDVARNAALGAVAGSLALFGRSRVGGLSEWAGSAVSGAERYLGIISTRVANMSPVLLRRMREHERGVLTRTNDYLKAIGPFVEGLRKVPEALRSQLDAAILTGDPAKVAAVLGRLGNPALVRQFREVRNLLDKVGRELMQAGKLKGLLAEYYPRIVVDVPGLLKALGQEQRTYIEKLIADATRKTQKEALRDLTPFETSQIINKALKSQPQGGRPGFLKKRAVDEITPELAKYYAPASESLPLYLRAVSKELERARFFGENLLRDPVTGAVNLDESIGNLVREEQLAGRVTPDQAAELGEILRSRFGPGERATSAPLQTAKNLAYAGLLGHVTSAITQLGDIAIAAAAHGILPTVKSLQQNLTRQKARATVHDLGMIDHMAEEIVGASRTPVTVLGRQVSTAKFLDRVFKYSLFSQVDTVGKNVSIQASRNKLTAWANSPAGIKKLEAKYGAAYGKADTQQLIADLRSGELTELVKATLFSELSDVQPISKLEVPQGYLDNPNGRVLYMLKTFMLKQADIVRREVVQEFRKGSKVKATQNAMRFGLALGIGGAGTQWINNWILGRDQEPGLSDIPLNAMKTFGWSQYTLDKVRQGKVGEAVADVAAPPYKMFDTIISQDPSAIQYLPVFGRIYYARDWFDLLEESGADKANRRYEQQQRREEREE